MNIHTFHFCCFQASAVTNPLHPSIMKEISEQLEAGVTSVGLMSRQLRRFVERQYPDASRADASYYPNRLILSSAMYSASKKLRYSAIDELNVAGMVRNDKWL